MSSPSATPPAPTLVKKLAAVMKEVGRIEKKGYNSFHKYKYVMEADLVETLSQKLADRHVFITSSTKGIEIIELGKVSPKTGEIVPSRIGVLRVEYTFHDGESGETLTMESIGEIDQDGGKGLYKALTGSMKYFLMKNFLIATGDDPEQGSAKSPAQSTSSRPAVTASKSAASPVQKKVATAQQITRIGELCKDLNQDIKVVYTSLKIKGNPSEDQASDIIMILEKKLAKALDKVAATESK